MHRPGQGEKIWSCELDIYGKVRRQDLLGERTACPFRYPGQYEDEETGLYYNRFRYYSPHEGMYTQQDPIGLAGGNPTLYGYVSDPNFEIDVFGLAKKPKAPPQVFSKKEKQAFLDAREDILNGRGTPHDVYQGREYPRWAGANEHRVVVPGESDKYRILELEIKGKNGEVVKKLGYSKDHYTKIHDDWSKIECPG